MMRGSPYPIPPSLSWTATALASYAVLALTGGLVSYIVATSGQSVQGWIVLGLWGGLTFPSSVACLWGVARNRYRWEWLGCWGVFMGTSIYLVVTTMGVLAAPAGILTAAPTILFFVYGLGKTLGRAIELSLVDLDARRRLVATQTGELPEVRVNE